MLNLSDKDLDRLSQEAAQQYEPGDIGPKLWEKLEVRLDRDLGKVNPNPAQGARHLRYFYAPVAVVILGVGFYFVRINHKSAKGMSSGSPPFASVQPNASGQKTAPNSPSNQSRSDKQNSTLPSNTVRYPDAGGASAANGSNVHSSDAGSGASAGVTSRSDDRTKPGTTSGRTPGSNPLTSSSHAPGSNPLTSSSQAPGSNSLTSSSHAPGSNSLTSSSHAPGSNSGTLSGFAHTANQTPGSRFGLNRGRVGAGNHHGLPPANPGIAGKAGSTPASDATSGIGSSPYASTPNLSASAGMATNNRKPGELDYSPVGSPVRLTRGAVIDDSALRAFNLSSIPQPINRRGGLHINRSLVFGLHGAPDFASVSSVAGDKAGSTFGLTVDYQFANHVYIGTGLLYSRKIFAAAPQDYHVPPGYYSQNNMGMGMTSRVEIIKGRFDMLEVPLNVRYDFSTGDNALFFLTAGTSSYFFTSQNCGYYYTYFSQPQYKQVSYGDGPTLFSTINLSAGGEFGISNSLSVLIAPYLKIPTRNLGFGQVQLTSIGIDFAVRFAPVISRKR